MKFKTHGHMKSHAGVDVDANVAPVAFRASAGGALEGKVGSIAAGIREVPFRLAIPFLRPRHHLPVVAAIGGVHFRLSPFELRIEGTTVHFEGVLGTEGLHGSAEGKVSCETEMGVAGGLSGRVGTFTVELDDEDVELRM